MEYLGDPHPFGNTSWMMANYGVNYQVLDLLGISYGKYLISQVRPVIKRQIDNATLSTKVTAKLFSLLSSGKDGRSKHVWCSRPHYWHGITCDLVLYYTWMTKKYPTQMMVHLSAWPKDYVQTKKLNLFKKWKKTFCKMCGQRKPNYFTKKACRECRQKGKFITNPTNKLFFHNMPKEIRKFTRICMYQQKTPHVLHNDGFFHDLSKINAIWSQSFWYAKTTTKNKHRK